jgi:Ca2+-binding EF-hand superfamily protein
MHSPHFSSQFTDYLESVFLELSRTSAFQNEDSTPAEMAQATAEQCFEEADADGSGTLTFDQFRAWLASNH